MRGQHVRDTVQQRGNMTGKVRVPRVRVHHIGTSNLVRDLQVHAHRRERRICACEFTRNGVSRYALYPQVISRPVKAMYPHISVLTQHCRKLSGMNTGTPVDKRWVFSSQKIDSHTDTVQLFMRIASQRHRVQSWLIQKFSRLSSPVVKVSA
jgi:hypothetical protein